MAAAAQKLESFDPRLFDEAQQFTDDPLGFVYWVFPWGEENTELANEDGPDDWQADILDRIGTACQTKRLSEELPAIMLAVASGHGIGKSALVAWIIIWFLVTRVCPQIVVTANTETQLTTKTWRELSKWHRISILEPVLRWTNKKFHVIGRADDWFAAAIPWSKANAQGFAGTHATSVLMIFDEASEIIDMIWETAEGAMTDKEALWLCFANPTLNIGRFRECFRKFRKRWITKQIDSRTTKRANKAQIKMWAEDYGEDSDFFRVRVRGIFPRSGLMQFMDEDLVYGAIERHVTGWESSGTVLSIDVGRGKGSGDPTKAMFRQGTKIHWIKEFREIDEMQCVGIVSLLIADHNPDATVLDVGGLGGGVYSRLTQLRFKIVQYFGGFKAIEDRNYYNLRAECYNKGRQWLKTGSIPDDPLFIEDLTALTYAFDKRNRIQLIIKVDLVAMLGRSTDAGDTFAQSFSVNVPNKTLEKDGDYMEKILAKYAASTGEGRTQMSR